MKPMLTILCVACVALMGCQTAPTEVAVSAVPSEQTAAVTEAKAETAAVAVKPVEKVEAAKAETTAAVKEAVAKPAEAVAAVKEATPKPAEAVAKVVPPTPAVVKAPPKPAEATKEAPPVKIIEPAKVEPKKEAPKKPAPKPEPPKPLGDVAAKSWTVPGADDPAKWAAQGWANPGSTAAEGSGVKLTCDGGATDKTAMGLALKADLASRGALVLDVTNPQEAPINIALAILTTKGDRYYESPEVAIKPGENKDVTISLTASNYKCTSSEWKFAGAVAGLESVTQVCLVIYTKTKASLVVSNVRLTAE